MAASRQAWAKPKTGDSSQSDPAPDVGAVTSYSRRIPGHPNGGDSRPLLIDQDQGGAAFAVLARGLAVLIGVLLTAHLLAGCGGGDPEPDQPTPDVNCALQPVVCK